jgi:pyruvate/2-oxoglutarate dehydrogenase complex dihydrolipoamide dehydrogenase (E3) component
VTTNQRVIVIGGGPAGVTVALQARELGAAVALVEHGPLGGTCTNDGCLPTRGWPTPRAWPARHASSPIYS